MKQVRIIAAVALIFIAPMCSAFAEQKSTLAGAARIDITPDGPIRLSGYGARTRESEGVDQRLFAKALAIGGDAMSAPAVLVTFDGIGITSELTDKIAKRLNKQKGLAPERIAICASHTHSAPMLSNLLPTIFREPVREDQQERIDAYTNLLVRKIVQVAIEALDDRQPAYLSWSKSQATFAANRRTPGGPVDHSVPVLRVTGSDGELIAILANYACHGTTLTERQNRIHGDWAGVAQEVIEKQYPGCLAMIAIGCGADANPKPRGTLEHVDSHGLELAYSVADAISKPGTPIDPHVRCRAGVIDLPFDKHPTLETWRKRAERSDAAGYHARVNLARLARGESLRKSLSYRIVTWTFGHDLGMVFLPGEVVVDYAIRIQADFRRDRMWVCAYANGCPCYIPSRRIWREGGYEAAGAMTFYDQPTRLAGETEELIMDTVQRLLPHEFYSDAKQIDFPAPIAPADAVSTFQLKPGLKIELACAEPLVADPVAFDWGPDGRLWVVEMAGYPLGIDGKGTPGGRIKVLTDDDGDGKFDRASLFMAGVNFPTGVKAWREGVLVVAAPEIFYAEDTNADGKADYVKTLYQGFGEGNEQHRVNGLRWGLDNWLYLANGDSGGKVTSLLTDETLDISGRDLRIKPATGQLDAQSGQTQFGRCRDDWGNWFGGYNSNPMWQYMLRDHYLRRNPHIIPPEIINTLARYPDSRKVFPASRTLERFNDSTFANRFTSACNPIIYRDNYLGEDFYGNSFVCEPVHNLIHREVVSATRLSFTSRRAEEEQDSEFLASTDNWFRPVMVRTGPDGALWIADMYRFVIEHPEWIPRDALRRIDLRAGEDRGRIYRIFPASEKNCTTPRLDALGNEELIAHLESPNGTLRDMVQQLLVWRQDSSAKKPLLRMLATSKKPLARLHALCTLDGANLLTPQVVLDGLSDSHSGVRRHAIRLSEKFAANARVQSALLDMLTDEDLHVRMQLAYSLGEIPEDVAVSGLADLVFAQPNDKYLLTAVLSSLESENILLFAKATLVTDPEQKLPVRVVDEIARIAGQLVTEKQAASLLRAAFESGSAALTSTVAEFEVRDDIDLAELCTPEMIEMFRRQTQDARQVAGNTDADADQRAAAIRWLATEIVEKLNVDEIGSLIRSNSPPAVQKAAVEALGSHENVPKVMSHLITAWSSGTPALRAHIFEFVSNQPEMSNLFLKAVEENRIEVTATSTRQRDHFLNNGDESIRRRADKLFQRASSEREQVVNQYLSALALPCDPGRGRIAFQKHCSVCHRLENEGRHIGPDLTALSNRSPHALLVAILDPSRAVEEKFKSYVAFASDGRQVSGMIVQETSVSVTLDAGEGKKTTLARAEIEELRDTGLSLMPIGLERQLTNQQIADIVAYVRSVGPKPKSFANHEPSLVTADEKGVLVLAATNCRIYGPRLTFDQEFRNLGWWISDEDRAVWSLTVPRTGEYLVFFDSACTEEEAGKRFVMEVGGNRLTGIVESTGSWNTYREVEIGKVRLTKGIAELSLRSVGEIESELMRLRTIHLTPIESEY